MSDNVKFIPVITQNLDGFAKQDGQIVVDVVNNKIAVDANSERFVVANKPAIDASISTLDTKLTNNITQVDTKYASEVITINTNKQDKLIAGDNITIAEDGKTISATSTVNYNELENKPIINIDLATPGFTPVLGQYYKHIGADIILEGTEFDPAAQYSRIYFNTNLSNEAAFNYISSNFDFVSSKGQIKIANLKVDSEDFLDLWLYKANEEETGDTIFLGDSGYFMGIFNLTDTSFPYGWNNGNRFSNEGGDWGIDYLAFISEGAVTFTVETTADATKLKKLISPTPFAGYLKDTIYKCTSLSPLTYEKVLTSADLINYHDAAKQDRINYFGEGLDYDTEYSELSIDFDTVAKKTDLNNKQDKLTAGNNISINNNSISAIDTTYSAGENIDIYAGSGELLNSSNFISALYFNRYLSTDDIDTLCAELVDKYGTTSTFGSFDKEVALTYNQSDSNRLCIYRLNDMLSYKYFIIYGNTEIYNGNVGNWTAAVAANGSFNIPSSSLPLMLYVKPGISGWNGKLVSKSVFGAQPTIAAPVSANVLLAANDTIKKIWTGTQAQYDEISPKEPTTLYIVKEA